MRGGDPGVQVALGRAGRLALCGPLAAVLLAARAVPAAGQETRRPLVLILSQPATGSPGADFVDMSYFVVRGLTASGKLEALVFRPDAPPVQQALGSGRLQTADVTTPLSLDAAHRVAAAVGADLLLRVGGARTSRGISASAQLDQRLGQAAWSSLFSIELEPYRGRSQRSQLVDAVNAHVSAIVERVTGARPAPITEQSGPVARPDGAGKGKGEPAGPPPTADRPGPGSDPKPPTDSGAAEAPAPRSETPTAREVLIAQFRRGGDSANLIVAVRRAIDERPRDPALRRELVEAYRDRGWSAAARDEAARALALAPEDALLRRLLGDTLAESGDLAAALETYREAVRLSPSASNQVALGDALWESAQPDEAQQAYEAAARADARDPAPQRRLALLNARRGKLAESADRMRAAAALTSDSTADAFTGDLSELMALAEGVVSDLLADMQRAHSAFLGGTHTREQAFRAFEAARDRLQGILRYLDSLPARGPAATVAALHMQATALGAQAAEVGLLALQSQSDTEDREYSLLRLEAVRQLAEAGTKRKALAEHR